MSLTLAVLGLALASPPAVRVVHTSAGEAWTCWEPLGGPDPVYDGAFDTLLRVGSRTVWASQRCVRGQSAVSSVGDAGWTVDAGPAAADVPSRFVGWLPEPSGLPTGTLDVVRAPDGALWMPRCRQGLTRLDPVSGARRTWTERDGLPPGCVVGVSVDDAGSAWAIASDRATRLSPEGLDRLTVRFDPVHSSAVTAVTIGGGRLWLAGQGGRIRGLPLTEATVHHLERTAGEVPVPEERRFDGGSLGALSAVSALRYGPDGRLWISSRGRLTALEPEEGRFRVWVARGPDAELPEGRPGPVVFAPDGAFVLVLPDAVEASPAVLLRIDAQDAVERVDLPGLPMRPLRLHATDDGALWIADEDGLVRVDPERRAARRVAVGRGYVPGGPWAVQACAPDQVWAAFEGGPQGSTLHRLGPGGEVLARRGPVPQPSAGRLVPVDDGVLLATREGFWQPDLDRARWVPHPGFGDGLRGWSAEHLHRIVTGASGRTWIVGRDGARVGQVERGFEELPPLGSDPAVFDVQEAPDGSTYLAAAEGLMVRDGTGRLLRVVDDSDRAVRRVDRLALSPSGDLWAWGEGGAYIVRGSDATRELAGPVFDLLFEGEARWWVRSDGIYTEDPGGRRRADVPRQVRRVEQIAVRDGALAWIGSAEGLWRPAAGHWSRVPGSDGGELLRSRDGTLWRWDPDGLHLLPAGEGAWRWVGLPGRDEPEVDRAPDGLIAADALTVVSVPGVLAVRVAGRLVGDPYHPDPIIDLDVRGDRWAVLSARGVLVRGQGYRLIEQSFAPGPARRVAVAPRGACVAGVGVWCRDAQGWHRTLRPSELPAPLPAVDLQVDDEGRAVSLHPGAWCRQGMGCRGLPGLGQTSLSVRDGRVIYGSTQGLREIDAAGSTRALWSGAVLDMVQAPRGLWLATEQQGLVELTDDAARSLGVPYDPRGLSAAAVHQVARARSGVVWIRVGDALHAIDVRPEGSRRPLDQGWGSSDPVCVPAR